jgi:hypothetical protein
MAGWCQLACQDGYLIAVFHRGKYEDDVAVSCVSSAKLKAGLVSDEGSGLFHGGEGGQAQLGGAVRD